MLRDKLKSVIRSVEDFPKKGIVFKDIMPVLEKPELCTEIVDEFIHNIQDIKIDAVVAIESRGFIFGMLLAHKLKVPFVAVRKEGKLPGATIAHSYNLEYGSATVEIHKGSIKKGWNVLVHDDLLATGGTAVAASELIIKEGGKVAAYSFLVELKFLNGSSHLKKFTNRINSLVEY